MYSCDTTLAMPPMTILSLLRTLAPAFLLSALPAPAIHAQAAPLAQDYTVVFHNPNPEFYVEGPGLARLDDGSFVAVVPIVPRNEWSAERRATQSVTHIMRSTD